MSLPDKDLNAWLSDLEQRNSQEIQLGLTRIAQVAERLQLLNPACKVITVAGTNGKGSTVAALETIYHQAGYRVASYTSPHLLHFNERIRVNLTPIASDDLCACFRQIDKARGDIVLTYFEMTTLAALYYFQQQNPDIIVLEVGLGGRLDATNIIDSDVAVITTIDYDHQDFLGSTLEAIGYEKAGIMRAGRPAIYADIAPPLSILARAKELNAPVYLLDNDYFIQERDDKWGITCSDREVIALSKPSIQLKSAAAAIMACLQLQDALPVSDESIAAAMQTVFIPGRLQWQAGDVAILYDVSHNAQSVDLLVKTIKKLAPKPVVHAVFSALKDKDLINLILPLKDCVNHWYPAQLTNKRAASMDLLQARFAEAEIFVDSCYNSPLNAFEAAKKKAVAGDLIVVYGSFYTVGEVYCIESDNVKHC